MASSSTNPDGAESTAAASSVGTSASETEPSATAGGQQQITAATADQADSPSTPSTTTQPSPSAGPETNSTSSPAQPRTANAPVQTTDAPSTVTPSNSSTTASMLPRSTAAFSSHGASSAASSSSASSGTTTPTPRYSTTGLSPFNQSPRSTSSALASSLPSSQPRFLPTMASAVRARRHPVVPSHSDRATPVVASTARAMASTDGSNAVPSIFGFYSHDGSATTQATSSNASTSAQPGVASGWRTSSSSTWPDWHPRPAEEANPSLVIGPQNASPQNGGINVWARQHTRRTAPPNPPLPTSLGVQRSTRTRIRLHQDSTARSSAFNASTASALPSSLPSSSQATFEETTTISFTWTIRDMHLLREEVELSSPPSEGGRSVSAGAGKSDVWTNQPVFGDGKWKLELIRTTRSLTDQPQHTEASSWEGDNDESMSAPPVSVQPMAVEGENLGENAQRDRVTILSVYLTALVLDYTHANVEIPASIMVGLRPVRAAAARSGADNGGWIWRRFYDYTFHKEADLFTCHDLPSVSEMLQDVNVARDDAIALTIQLGLGPGHMRSQSDQLDESSVNRMPVEVDGHHLVPTAVLNSLHGLLDDANTGDVRILVRERGIMLPQTSVDAAMSDDGHHPTSLADDLDRVVPYPIGSSCPVSSSHGSDADVETDAVDSIETDPDRIFVRDRVLWAHTSVLKSRSDYFQTMLASDFREGMGRSYGVEGTNTGRNVRTLRIPDADFVTTYWFLRYLYTEDIRFADKEDVRSAVLDEEWAKGADRGHMTVDPASDEAGMDGSRNGMLIDWTPISQLNDDRYLDEEDDAGWSFSMARDHTSSSSTHRRIVSGSFGLNESSSRGVNASSATTSGSLRPRTSASGVGAGTGGGTTTGPSSPAAPGSSAGPSGTSKHHTTDEPSRISNSNRNTANTSASRSDPHPHPCSDPGPASALSIFKLAHRYHLQDLSRLASLHMVATLTPQSAFPMLLATSMYTELHTRIKTYVYQHWHLVSHTDEFERCCDEVSVGMWGSDAGKTMRAFVRSLVSPLRAAQS